MNSASVNPFYHHLAAYYDSLFPLNPASFSLIKTFLSHPNCSILDIGSATGQLALQLARLPNEKVMRVTALEPDPKMTAILQKRCEEENLTRKLEIVAGDTSVLKSLFPHQSYHMILCLGNTLVHLENLQQVEQFFSTTHDLLTPGSPLIIQIVNYTRILKNHITQLPLLDKPGVMLERNYTYNPKQNKIHFLTRLTIKAPAKTLEHETILNPLEAPQLEGIAKNHGFNLCHRLGSYQGEPWHDESPATILIFTKI